MSDEPRVEFARRICSLCDMTSVNFAKKADEIERYKSLIDAGSVLFALATAFLTLTPALADLIGQSGSAALTLTAATLLVLRASIERIFLKDPSSRFRDYALYIGYYPQKISSELSRTDPDWTIIDSWVELATVNLNDARAKWPALVYSDSGLQFQRQTAVAD